MSEATLFSVLLTRLGRIIRGQHELFVGDALGRSGLVTWQEYAPSDIVRENSFGRFAYNVRF